MTKLKVSELLRLACIYAEDDRLGYADAYPAGAPERAEALDLVRQLRAYRTKRWGKSKLEAGLETMVPVPVPEIAAREPWQTCAHEWGPPETIREPDFGVAYGSLSVCKICRARCFEDRTAMRASSVDRVLAPEPHS